MCSHDRLASVTLRSYRPCSLLESYLIIQELIEAVILNFKNTGKKIIDDPFYYLKIVKSVKKDNKTDNYYLKYVKSNF